MNTSKEVQVIKTMADFAGLEPGQPIQNADSQDIRVFLGRRFTGSCPCGGEIFPAPMILRSIDPRLVLETVISIDKPQPKKITNISLLEFINPEHPEYTYYKKLLDQTRQNLVSSR